MSRASINRQIGSILVVIGTEVGAGILALPILVAHIGFPLGCVVMLVAWLLMTYTALLVCEVNLAFEDGANFAHMAKHTTGFIGQVVVWVSMLLLLYTIMIAYISAAGSAFGFTFGLPKHLLSLIFVLFFGTLVVIGTTTVDWVNRLLLGAKLIMLIFSCVALLPHINVAHLLPSFFDSKIMLAALPVFVTTFTSHVIIPPIRTYLKSDIKALVRVLVIGSLIPLVLYLLWVIAILGVIPYFGHNSFAALFATHKTSANIGDILELIKENLHSNIFYAPVSLFSNISVTTSFLGVSFALYHFVIDGFKLRKLNSNWRKNIVAVLLTFVLPVLVVWYFPNIFIKALGLVGLCCCVLLIIIPVVMINNLKSKNHIFKIKYISNRAFLMIALFLGIAVSLIEIFISN